MPQRLLAVAALVTVVAACRDDPTATKPLAGAGKTDAGVGVTPTAFPLSSSAFVSPNPLSR